MIQRHAGLYQQRAGVAQRLLRLGRIAAKFVKIMPKDYKRMLEAFDRVQAQGFSGDEAAMAAFESNKSDVSRVGGN